jgi:hypothetical protein
MGEGGRRERLLQMCGAFVEYAVMDDGSLGVRGSEKDSSVRMGSSHHRPLDGEIHCPYSRSAGPD